jgi:transketolase
MRLFRKPASLLYPEDEEFELGKGKVLVDGTDITLIASGVIMVNESLKARVLLEQDGISAVVIDMHTIKPIDSELILTYAKKTEAIITCENHQIVNGLGSAVAEVLSENYPILMKRIGINDEFGEVGTQEFLQERYQLTAENIVNSAKELLKKKNLVKN